MKSNLNSKDQNYEKVFLDLILKIRFKKTCLQLITRVKPKSKQTEKFNVCWG